MKGYTPNWYKEVFVIKNKLKILFHGHLLLVISDLSNEEIVGTFYKKELKKKKKKKKKRKATIIFLAVGLIKI